MALGYPSFVLWHLSSCHKACAQPPFSPTTQTSKSYISILAAPTPVRPRPSHPPTYPPTRPHADQEKFYFSPGDTGIKVFRTRFADIGGWGTRGALIRVQRCPHRLPAGSKAKGGAVVAACSSACPGNRVFPHSTGLLPLVPACRRADLLGPVVPRGRTLCCAAGCRGGCRGCACFLASAARRVVWVLCSLPVG